MIDQGTRLADLARLQGFSSPPREPFANCVKDVLGQRGADMPAWHYLAAADGRSGVRQFFPNDELWFNWSVCSVDQGGTICYVFHGDFVRDYSKQFLQHCGIKASSACNDPANVLPNISTPSKQMITDAR